MITQHSSSTSIHNEFVIKDVLDYVLMVLSASKATQIPAGFKRVPVLIFRSHRVAYYW